MKKIIVIIPTFNEAENIEKLINTILLEELDVLVVDDNSPDKTYEIVQEIQNYSKNVNLLIRDKKQGLGSAYRDGFAFALKNNYEYVIQMDADFSHSIDDLKNLMFNIGSADLIIGSRYITGGKTEGWSKSRLFLSKFANIFANYMCDFKVSDSTSGFRIYSSNALSKNNFEKTNTDGYGFQIEMTFNTFVQKIKIIEVPITFHERRSGKSKMNFSIIFEAFKLLFLLKFRKKSFI